MSILVGKLRKMDFSQWAISFLLLLWVASTFAPALMQIFFVVALLCWGMTRVQDRASAILRDEKVLWCLLSLFCILVVLSFFTSEYPKESWRGLWKIAMPVFIFVMNVDLFRSEKNQEKFFVFFLIAFLFVTIDSSFQLAFGRDLFRHFSTQTSNSGSRLVGPLGDFGKMSAYLLLVIPVFGMWTVKEFRTNRGGRYSVYYFFLAIAAFILLYLTRSRGAFLACILSLFFLFMFQRWFKALGAGLLFLLAVLAITPKSMITHLNAQAKEQSVTERIVLWTRALDVIRAKPFTGTGINTYDIAHGKYDIHKKKNLLPFRGTSYQIRQNQDGSVSFTSGMNTYTSDVKQSTLNIGPTHYHLLRDTSGDYYIYTDLVVRGYYAHEGYLQLAAETGIPCVLSFLVFWGLFLGKAVKRIKRWGTDPEAYFQLGILAGLFSFLLYALVDTNLQSPQSIIRFWFLAGILMARQSVLPKVTAP